MNFRWNLRFKLKEHKILNVQLEKKIKVGTFDYFLCTVNLLNRLRPTWPTHINFTYISSQKNYAIYFGDGKLSKMSLSKFQTHSFPYHA